MIVNNLGLIEAGLTFTLVIGFCVYQYIVTQRSLAEDRRKAAELDAARHAEGEHALNEG